MHIFVLRAVCRAMFRRRAKVEARGEKKEIHSVSELVELFDLISLGTLPLPTKILRPTCT